jgi:hypothetical protein
VDENSTQTTLRCPPVGFYTPHYIVISEYFYLDSLVSARAQEHIENFVFSVASLKMSLGKPNLDYEIRAIVSSFP